MCHTWHAWRLAHAARAEGRPPAAHPAVGTYSRAMGTTRSGIDRPVGRVQAGAKAIARGTSPGNGKRTQKSPGKGKGANISSKGKRTKLSPAER